MSQEENRKSTPNFQIIVFKQGNEEYALRIDQIKEVVITPAITRMPQTPDFIKGVANIRGNIIALIDLEEKFNIKHIQASSVEQRYTLVIESEDFRMGILVRDVPNTITVAASDFDESFSIINDGKKDNGYIKGVIKTGGRLIVLIDIFKVIEGEIAGTVNDHVPA